MKIRRSLKSFASSIFPLFISLVTVNSFAGGPEVQPNPWTMSVGVFGAIYGADFKYESNFRASTGGTTNSPNFTSYTQQFGYSGGGEAQIQYHINRFYLDLGVSGQSNSRQGNNTWVELSPGALPFLFQNAFRINYNVDVTGGLGTDLTSCTHIYGKLGASYAQLKQQFAYSRYTPVTSLPPVFQETTHKGLWGYVAGLGIAEDLARYVSLFTEFDYYDYGKTHLNTYTNITPVSGATDRYTQQVTVDAYTIRLGLDFNFAV